MNLIIFNNLSLYSILKELNKFFNYNLHDHIENIDILVRLTNENPDFLVITDKKIITKLIIYILINH